MSPTGLLVASTTVQARVLNTVQSLALSIEAVPTPKGVGAASPVFLHGADPLLPTHQEV